MKELYAHSRDNTPREQWQTLEAHSRQVAELAAKFAEAFQSAEWARIVGLLHDAGKARHSFQAYLAQANGLDDAEYDSSDHSHSGAGACWANKLWNGIGRIFAYCIAGHHAGLPDWESGETPNGALRVRLDEESKVLCEPSVQTWLERFQDRLSSPRPPFKFEKGSAAFWIRMLYSCLVDADFLDTEAFMDAEKSNDRGGYPELAQLARVFFERLDDFQRKADVTEVNKIRAEIRARCELVAENRPGVYSLTVPTGGGKTLSSMAFALRHALKHGQRRVVYVIPYTSIIEQTADILRGIFGAENVLEHHSNFDPEKETQRSRLASENWDAPIVVTTSVQFFESLYACKSSRCRKLHNLAGSVIILDEVQLLPMNLIKPCTLAIKELAAHYGATLVLSTATQPKLPGLESVTEIIPAEMDLFARLKRTEWEFPASGNSRKTWREIADELKEMRQVLCVVNTRRDCRELFDLMPSGTVHLSASMCGAHRSKAIAGIKEALKAGKEIRVISTQLVEAGVDVDFPVVYRAFTGLSSIAQSAGRCNREGKLSSLGRVVVFLPPKESPRGILRFGEYAMQDMLCESSGLSFDSPEAYPRYFAKLQTRVHSLGEEFAALLQEGEREMKFQFREAAAGFRMIDNSSVAVAVRYEEGESLIEEILRIGPHRRTMRKLQRFTVNVPRNMLGDLREKGFVEEISPGIYAQTPIASLYSGVFGFDLFRDGLSAEDTIM
ncbi:MAG: CRISPR-associated endonuclease Cas3'' [Kiritimatiellia bacterium]